MINHPLYSTVLGNGAFALPPASNAAIFSASGSGFSERDGSWSVPAELRGSPSREKEKGRLEIRQRLLLRITSPCAPLALALPWPLRSPGDRSNRRRSHQDHAF